MAWLRALPLVLRWCVICAAAPSTLWAMVVVVSAFSQDPESTISSLGLVVVVFIYTGPAGAALGLLWGWLDLTLGRRVARHPRRRRSVGAAAVQMAGVLTLTFLLLQLVLAVEDPFPTKLAFSAAFAIIPAVICWRRYANLATAPTPEKPSPTR